MKTLVRTLIILLAAVLVSGATYAFGQSGAAQSLLARGRGRGGEFERGGFPPPEGGFERGGGAEGGFRPPEGGFERGPGEGRRGGGLFGAVQMVRPLLIITLIIAGGALLSRVFGRRSGRGNRRPPSAAAPPA